jgi:Sec-independent protein translocase protein TatA
MKTLVILGLIAPYKIVLPTLLIIMIIVIAFIYNSRKREKRMRDLAKQMRNEKANSGDTTEQMKEKKDNSSNIGDNEFYVKAINEKELSECSVGDSVSLWKNPEKDYILVFRHGFAGGEGRLGQVANSSYEKIASHFKRGDSFKAEISSIQFNDCKIKFQVITKEELDKQKEQSLEDRRNDLQKPYKPKSDFDLFFSSQSLVGTGLKKGSKLQLIFKKKDFYLKDPYDLIIYIADMKGSVLGHFTNSEALRPLKAYFNDYKFDVTVTKKEEDSVYLKVKPYKD